MKLLLILCTLFIVAVTVIHGDADIHQNKISKPWPRFENVENGPRVLSHQRRGLVDVDPDLDKSGDWGWDD